MRPDNIDINRSLAKIYQMKKDPQNSLMYLEKASRTNSKHPELIELKQNI